MAYRNELSISQITTDIFLFTCIIFQSYTAGVFCLKHVQEKLDNTKDVIMCSKSKNDSSFNGQNKMIVQ